MKTKRTPTPDLETLVPILIGCWRRFHKESGPADKLQTREFRSVVDCVIKLHNMYDNDMSLIGKDYFADRNMLGAYLLYQWVIHYQEGLSLMGELPFAPRRVLDVCSGPGAFAFAALRHGATEVYATDQNSTALQLAAEVAGRYGMPLTSRKWNCLKEPLTIEGKFDLIILGHCLDDLFPKTVQGWPQRQKDFIDGLMKRLTPHGHLMIVDDSFKEANQRILQLRDQLVNEGISVQAPCVWRGECPALKAANSPCYAQREMSKPYIIKEIQRAAQINLNSLKMTYVIFRAPGAEWPVLPSDPLYRVISPPVESHFGKRYYLCGTDGKKNLGSTLKEYPAEVRAFEYLKRGELISIEDGSDKQTAIDLIEGSKLKVIAACGKPLIEPETES